MLKHSKELRKKKWSKVIVTYQKKKVDLNNNMFFNIYYFSSLLLISFYFYLLSSSLWLLPFMITFFPWGPLLNPMYTWYKIIEKSGSKWGIFPLSHLSLVSFLPSSSYSIITDAVLSYVSCQLFVLLDSLSFPVANHFYKDVALWVGCQLA